MEVKLYYYKGFKVEAFPMPLPPSVPGGIGYRFCQPYSEIYKACGFPDMEEFESGRLEPKQMPSIFDGDVKGIEPGDDLPVLDLSSWPIAEYMPFILRDEDKKDETEFWHRKYRCFMQGSYVFQNGEKFGIKDKNTNIIVAPIWDEIRCVHQDVDFAGIRNYFTARQGHLWGIVRGVWVPDVRYDSIEYLGRYPTSHPNYKINYFIVTRDGCTGISDGSSEVIPCGMVAPGSSKEYCHRLLMAYLGK